jgi:hypothetical protein
MITYERVRELFDYHPDGYFIRKIRTCNAVNTGDIVGHIDKDGYVQVGIQAKHYRIHRLVWLWHNGYMPENFIDHINRNKIDNRIENLREVTNQCNIRNTGNRENNTSGVKGVSWYCSRNKWTAQIMVNHKQYHLGYYKEICNAVLARLAAEQCLGWEGCDSNSPAYQYAIKNGLFKSRKLPITKRRSI